MAPKLYHYQATPAAVTAWGVTMSPFGRAASKNETRPPPSRHYIYEIGTPRRADAMNDVLRHLRRAALLRAGKELSDAQLLESFLVRREGAAFEILLRRHGPMVLGVCRRVLRNYHDAEDAFQATFLVLARKAGSVRSKQVLASWLYGVAHRTSLKARAMSAKRRAKERQSVERRVEPAPARDNDGLLERLDAELQRLPEKYRVPVILCELEGKSRREAAQVLGWPEGTLSCRLAQARKLLARRLSREANSHPGGALVAVLAQGPVPPALLKATAQAAHGGLGAGAVSAEVISLVDGVLKAMLLSKLKIAGLVTLVAALSVPVGLSYRDRAFAQALPKEAPAPRPAPEAAQPDDLEALRLEFDSLRKEVRALRERVKALERAQPGRPTNVRFRDNVPEGGGLNFAPKSPEVQLEFRRPADTNHAPPRQTGNPVDEAEAALRRLRANPDDRDAAEALEGAVKQLKQRDRPRKNSPQNKRP
jgi:RNA polymerase sigma factor (sigma-70 family)